MHNGSMLQVRFTVYCLHMQNTEGLKCVTTGTHRKINQLQTIMPVNYIGNVQ